MASIASKTTPAVAESNKGVDKATVVEKPRQDAKEYEEETKQQGQLERKTARDAVDKVQSNIDEARQTAQEHGKLLQQHADERRAASIQQGEKAGIRLAEQQEKIRDKMKQQATGGI